MATKPDKSVLQQAVFPVADAKDFFGNLVDYLIANVADTATIASASSMAIGAAAAKTVLVTGTTAITEFDSVDAGVTKQLVFADVLTLTHNATSLILPGAANITTAAGDVAIMLSLGDGNWRCIGYQRASGKAVSSVETLIQAAGDLLVGSGAGALARLALGSANLKLFINAAGNGLEYANGLKVGTFTRDMTAASGDASYTGVGFKPSMLIALAQIDGQAALSVGFANRCAFLYLGNWYNNGQLIDISLSGPAKQTAVVKTYDSDGFTLTWAKTGSPTGTATISYLALR